jgi:hypothetical protein
VKIGRAQGSMPTNPLLLEAMKQLALKDDAITRRAYYQAVMTGTFLIPVAGPSQPAAEPTRGAPFTQTFIMLKDNLGLRYMLAFTDTDALRTYKPEGCNVAIAPAAILLETAVRNEISTVMINYRYHTGAVLKAREIEALAEGIMPVLDYGPAVALTVPDGTPRTVRPLTGAPAGMVPALRAVLSEAVFVRQAFLFSSEIGWGKAHAVVGLELSAQPGAELGQLVDRLGRMMKEFLDPAEFVDIMVLDDDLLGSVSATLAPFYSAERRAGFESSY